jgi:hypothetical protein
MNGAGSEMLRGILPQGGVGMGGVGGEYISSESCFKKIACSVFLLKSGASNHLEVCNVADLDTTSLRLHDKSGWFADIGVAF